MVVLIEGNVLSDWLQPIGAPVSAHVLYPPGSLDIVQTLAKIVFFPPSPQASLPCPSTGCGSSPSWPPSPCRPLPFWCSRRAPQLNISLVKICRSRIPNLSSHPSPETLHTHAFLHEEGLAFGRCWENTNSCFVIFFTNMKPEGNADNDCLMVDRLNKTTETTMGDKNLWKS